MSSLAVFVVENVSPSLRGELSRWMIEPKPGVFVGKISALVREKLWEKIVSTSETGGGMLIYSNNNEQGYSVLSFGYMRRKIVNMDGLSLVKILK